MEINVCMLIQRFYPFVGGTEIQAWRLAQILQKHGLGIFVVTSRLKNTKAFEKIENLPVYRLFTLSSSWIGSVIFMFSSFWFLIKHRKDYQIIHVHLASSTAIIAIIVGKLFHKKILVKLGASREFGDITTSKKTFLGRFKLRFLRRYVDIFVAPSQEVKEELRNNYFSLEKIRVIPNGVDTDKFFPLSQKRKKELRKELNIPYEKIAIFIGRLTKQKGIEILIKAWYKIINTFPQLHLLIVGEGEERETLEQKAEEFDNIHFLGKREDIVSLLQASDVFVLPSLAEGLSNALLEAMACGLPLIATNIGGTKEVIENGINGILIEPGDIDSLYKKISFLFKNPEIAANLGINARFTVEKEYSLSEISQRYLHLYNKILCKD